MIPADRRCGVGLRAPHHAEWRARRPRAGWLEVHAENFFAAGGALPALLADLRCDYPLSLHGVGLGLGSPDPPDPGHVERLRTLVRRFEPALVSEHLCWGAHAGEHFNDLLPLPYTDEALARLVARVGMLQDALGRQVLIEHLAGCIAFPESTWPEGEFLAALARRSGCGILLDLNNLEVCAHNLGTDPQAFLDALPSDAVREIHLAGHAVVDMDGERLCIDDHGSPVPEPVWGLYREALRRFGAVPTLIEWDTDLPPLDVLLAEAARADREAAAVLGHG